MKMSNNMKINRSKKLRDKKGLKLWRDHKNLRIRIKINNNSDKIGLKNWLLL